MTTVPPFAALEARAHWRTVDFISDLHLKPEEPATFEAWADYMGRTRADAVLILGDLFEVWVGDDSALPGSFEARCGEVLQRASQRLDLCFMPGNRDFMVGADFLAQCGAQALADPTVLRLGTQRILLTHGDLLCTDDVAYQRFRQQVRNPAWQQAMLARPLAERQIIGQQLRQQSEHQQQAAAGQSYGDVHTATAHRWALAAGAHTLLHGHTHRPGDHALGRAEDGAGIQRVVLSDWHVAGNERRAEVMRLTAQGLQRLNPAEA